MRATLNKRLPLLAVILTLLLIAALAACSNLNTASPETIVPTLSLPTPTTGTQAEAPPADALKKADPAGLAVPAAETPPANDQPAQPCSGLPVCADLFVTQSGKSSRVGPSAQGLMAIGMNATPTQGTRWVIDTGTPSPDGIWVAFTSLGYEAGGPVFLQNLESGEYVNLIEQINAHPAEGQPAFPLDLNWDVIGWFPDSQRLLIGPSDLSMVMIVDRASYAAQVIGFAGGGKGGRAFVSLSPDGSSFLFFGESEAGLQTVSLYPFATGEITVLQEVGYESGFLSSPRFSPDGTRIAYIVQNGQPETGLTYTMNLLEREGGQPTRLVEGNLSMTAPNWSPDGSHIAFTRNDAAPALLAAADAPPTDPQGNVWVVSVADGTETQVTFIDGLARSPVWASDGRTLAFVTGAGEVELANIDQPQQVWQVAGPSDLPELTNVFFLP